MKRMFFILLLIALFAVRVFPSEVEAITLKESESVNFLEKMDQQGVFVKFIQFLDIDDENNFYFLDVNLRTIFRIDGKTGKLINTISSLGQGPGELYIPTSIRVKNKMVFIPDRGFGGVKIFTTDGKLITEFRTGPSSGWLDVNKKNEIFVREVDTDGLPSVAIYSMEGKKIRTLVRIPITKVGDKIEYLFTREFMFKLDSKENLVVLFDMKNIMRKYNTNGELLWEKEVTNKILEEHPRKKPKYGPGNTIHGSSNVFYFDIDQDDNIIVGHVGGATVFNKDGETLRLIKTDPPENTHAFKLFNNDSNLLRIIAGGERINIFSNWSGYRL